MITSWLQVEVLVGAFKVPLLVFDLFFSAPTHYFCEPVDRPLAVLYLLSPYQQFSVIVHAPALRVPWWWT